MLRILKVLLLISSISIALYAIVVYGFLELGIAVHPAMKMAYQAHPIGIYLHVFTSLVALAIGPFQFNTNLRRNNTKLHKLLGKIYLLGVLLGSLSGLYMAHFSFGGMVSHVGFICLAVLWFVTGFNAYTSIINKKIQQHYFWMFLNFSLTFAAVTLRIGLGIGFGTGIPFEIFYPYLAWICWVPNLIVATILLKTTYKKANL